MAIFGAACGSSLIHCAWCYSEPAGAHQGVRRWGMTSSRRAFLSSAACTAAASAFAGEQRGGMALPHGRISPLDGLRREKIKITGIQVISLGYRLKREEEWPDGDNN